MYFFYAKLSFAVAERRYLVYHKHYGKKSHNKCFDGCAQPAARRNFSAFYHLPGKAAAMTSAARPSFFSTILNPQFNSSAALDISRGGKVLIISDFHMGSGRRDDLHPNGDMVLRMLEDYYYKNGWNLILNGDIEELAKFQLDDIRCEWSRLYRVFDLFAAEGRLYKNLGNHDEDLVFSRGYPYALYNAVRVETGIVPVFVYHGHQASRIYTDYNNLIRLSLRYFLKPIGIRNISSARSPHRRFHVERSAYNFSLGNNCISVIGHTHRALFESLGRFDYIKFEIERCCRDYPSSGGKEREKIAAEVMALRLELSKLKRSERREGARLSLYGDELPVPCLFNSGSAIGKKGINAIELTGENIALVYWFAEGKGMKFVSRGRYKMEKFKKIVSEPSGGFKNRSGGGAYYRAVLNQDRLDYVKAKIDLFSNNPPPQN